MFQAACPGCGAAIDFRSPASVMAVCPYCQTCALKDGEAVKDFGKISQVLEDLSPLQVGVTGSFDGQHFTVLGRVQMTYEDGRWNEWYAAFDDGTAGWLSESSGQYVFTLPKGKAEQAPPFEKLRPGYPFTWDGKPFRASDVRPARCAAGQGELPFRVGEGWDTRAADFRVGKDFLTLDYTDGEPPEVFAGRAVTLEELKCQLLRDADEIGRTSGQYQGKIQALDCPNCGSPISYPVKVAQELVCPACHAEVSLSGDKAQVLKVHQILSTASTLRLGEIGNIDGKAWTVIGFFKARDPDDDESGLWTEYLLFNAAAGFLWLVESDQGWDKVRVLNELPTDAGTDLMRLDGAMYRRKWTYRSEVMYAAGAFNWRIHIGDQTAVSDYPGMTGTLTREVYGEEITWSRAERVGEADVFGWFGRPARRSPSSPVRPAAVTSPDELKPYFYGASGVLWLINLPLILFGNGSWLVALIAWGVLWVMMRMEG